MQHRSTPLQTLPLDAPGMPAGPSFETLCMLQVFARAYQPKTLKNSRLDKHLLA
jgi:hypothetical protein